MLFDVVNLFEKKKIIYHLEGGTLLGIVRDNDLLPWDHDVDISIPYNEIEKFLKVKKELYKKGYKISTRRSKSSMPPFNHGDYILFKVKRLIPSIVKLFFPWYKKNYIVLDIFIKKDDGLNCYWQAQNKLMRVENKFYATFETVNYLGINIKVPNLYRDYLTKKYGDWSIPIKEWECGKDEGTIVNN